MENEANSRKDTNERFENKANWEHATSKTVAR